MLIKSPSLESDGWRLSQHADRVADSTLFMLLKIEQGRCDWEVETENGLVLHKEVDELQCACHI